MKVNKYWIAGHAGTGKSTVHKELLRRGLNSFDGDKIPGLASWVEIATGKKVKMASPRFVDHSKIDWAWDGAVLENLLSTDEEIFVCGSAVNDIDFFDRFAKVFILTITAETQSYRLINRESDYGKDPRMHGSIIRETQDFANQLIKRGAIEVNAESPPEKVVDEILGPIK